MTAAEASEQSNSTRDPGQLVPGHVNTAPEIIGSWTVTDLKTYLPAILSFAAASVAVATGREAVAIGAFAAGVVLGLLGVFLRMTDRWYRSPRERVSAWLAHIRRVRGDSGDVLPEVTGLEDVTEQGHLRMADGRYVAPVPISPRTTALLDQRQRNDLAAALSSAIDEQLTDIPFRFFATTRETDVDDVAERYETQAIDPETPTAQQRVLLDVADWLREADAPNWDARAWRHYVFVEADESAVAGVAEPSLWAILNPFSDADEIPDAAVRDALSERVEQVQGAIGSVPGLEADTPTPVESVSVARRFWGRDDRLSEALTSAAVDDEIDVNHLAAPETWEPRRGWVDVGGHYARTFWLAEYPTEPDSLWLKDLVTLRGVNVDVCLNAAPVPEDEGIHRAASDAADTTAEGAERAEQGDVSAMDTDTAGEANLKMRELFAQTPSKPWELSTYVVVRADDRAALDLASEELASFADIDGAKRAALEDAADDVIDTLTSRPADVVPVAPGPAQEQAFRAASPLTRDVWDAATPADKKRLVPGGVIGSSFPFVGADLREDSGMDWGRNEETGTHLRLSPFERGGAPHMLTVGQTRSGKTYSASKVAYRWFLERPDERTLILCDTQRGFDGVTPLCRGKYVVVDGSQAVNPLRIEPPPDHQDEGENGFRMTVEETVGFLVGLLEADEVRNAGEFAPLLSQAAERALVDAGIDPDDPTTYGAGQPTLDDLLEVLVDMNDNPENYTWSNQGHEVESHRRQVGDLLTNLRSFQPGGKFASFVGEDELGIADESTRMVYLDLHAMSDSDDAEKSAMLQLMLSEVREKIKSTDGQVIAMFDEAHVLLDSPRTANWLQKASRETARHSCALWFLTQSPKDFVSGPGESDARDVIRAQTGMTHFFRTPGVDDEVLAAFGLNQPQREFIKNEAVRGKSGRGFSECLIGAEDVADWLPCYVEASPLEDRVLQYSRRDHGGGMGRSEDFRAHLGGGEGCPNLDNLSSNLTEGESRLVEADGGPEDV